MGIKTELYQFFASLIRNLGGGIGKSLRRFFYRFAIKKMGSGVVFFENVFIYIPYNLEIGNNSKIGVGTIISSSEKIKIGDEVAIGPYCCIYDSNHKMPKIPGSGEYILETAPIEIGDRSWIGAHSVILKGVKIGKDVTIGAGSLVSSDIPDNAVALGNPARVVKFNKPLKTKEKNKNIGNT